MKNSATSIELLPAHIPKADLAVFRSALAAMIGTGIPFTVGGAIAVRAYTGTWRYTHDLDIFVQPEHAKQSLRTLQSIGLKLTGSDPKWLYVTKKATAQMDIIFAFRNQVQSIDQLWIQRGRESTVASIPVLVASPEDTICSKTFIMNRRRFDWADCINIIAALQGKLDWEFLTWRLRDYPALFMAELLFCLQVYPQAREWIPPAVFHQLYTRIADTKPAPEMERPIAWFFEMDIVEEIFPT